MRRQRKRARRRGPLRRDDPHDLRNHVSGAAHDHRVADPDVLAAHLVLVVQRGVGHRHAADEYRLQPGHRRDGAGTSHLHVDADDLRRHLLRRKLVRYREPRRPRHETEALLQREVVDLVDHAVDLERQSVATLAHPAIIAEQPREAADDGTLVGHREVELRQPEHQRVVRGRRRERSPLRVADAICVEGKAAARGDSRVELAQAARGGIARVGERLVPLGGLSERSAPRSRVSASAPRRALRPTAGRRPRRARAGSRRPCADWRSRSRPTSRRRGSRRS